MVNFMGTLIFIDAHSLCLPHTRSDNDKSIFAGSELLTVVDMKISISYDKMPCSQLKVNRLFGEYVASIFKVKE
jgi:hypothetical protein